MTNEAAATPSAQPLLFGRYRVSEQLGETRLASVYAASDARLQRRVLLHLLRKDLVGQERPRARFVAEVGQMARRSHQALLEVFDSGEVSARPFIVTEHCAGRPLRELGLLTVEQAMLYMRQVAGAVAACQSQRSPEAPVGLYHPPISSSNVLLVDEGRVKLVDSWLVPAAEVTGDLAHYRAPELSEGRAATPATAVYALGLLLYELITGERPVSGADARATALAHLTAHIPPLRQARPGLYMPTAESLLARAVARAPERRFPDARAFSEALVKALNREVFDEALEQSRAILRAARGVPPGGEDDFSYFSSESLIT
ncbi:MAG: serine/threonine protein kinase, partial [Chloroflexales bacterium]|nr:serine/threonine protein kinase [Chloroflexales bacterium]